MYAILINESNVNRTPLGAYRIHWKDLTSSVAVVGMSHDGSRWFTCSNWTGDTARLDAYFDEISHMVPLE